ncbi:MAG: tetratricopeptide repeat protein, partial [Planctomycetota bacterium]
EAWRLTRGKLNLLPKEWVNLDPAYCVWALEQMRRQRVLDAGLEFALTMLLQEERLEPETAARIYLVKGDIYRDMRNFEAARAEYVSLQSRRRYAQTEPGERATYRLIELMLQTGNYAGAEQHIEPLLESGDLAVQAEGYFYLAEAAFAREEYAVCREYLMECFQRKAHHPEGRMLEGKLRPHLPRMLDVTRVKVGRETDKTVVVPGHELVVQLQDRNLAVVKGNKAIPVLVRTTVTGDEERIELHVSPGEKNVFSGSVATGLGEAQPGNFTLEVSGRDAIEYVIDPAFQKANDLDYGPKRMEVRSNARLSASAGEILTPEEEQQREMERQMLAMSEDEQSRRFAGRDGRTVRPGSPVYVQVSDADRDVSAEADTVRVSLETTSGDRLDEFVLTETGPHTGIFRGEVPTNVPFPRAEASDTEEGLSPISVINKTKNEPWRSLPDGKKPKWIEVDTMSSYAVASASIALPAPEEIRRARLLGALAEEDRIELAVFPQQEDVALGGATLRIAGDQAGHRAWQIRRHVARLGGERARIQAPTFDRRESTHGKRNYWLSYRIRAAFHLPENRVLELRFLQKPSPHNWQHAYLSIDGEEVLGGVVNGQTVKRSRPVSLSAGGHWLEILVRDHWQHGAVEVGYRREDGQFAPLPTEWFDPEARPALAEFLRPKGTMERTETGFAATLDAPQRLRRLRWVFEDFAGNAVAVDGMTVTDADGQQIIPVETDFAMGKTNETLEISPGDHIQVRYADDLRLGNAPPELGQTLNSSYYNGSILLANEEIYTEGDRRTIRYEAARRCRIGDQLSILVTDWDEDLTDERDRVDVVVETSAGERLELKALETHYWDQRDDRWHRHAGAFMQILKIGKETKGHTIKVTPGDTIFVRYLDRENTKPGIPVEREYSVAEAGLGEPRVTVYATRTRLVEDTSPEARARLDRMRARGRDVEGRKIWREQVLARHPHVEPNDKQKDIAPPLRESEDGALFVSINAPILFEIQYPRMALNSGSVYRIGAVAASELAAAKQEGREPRITETPLYLEDLGERAREKGYEPYLMRPMRLSEEDILRDGLFAGVLRLQMGSPGDEPDELVVLENLEFRPPAWRDRKGDANRVPTVVVNGADTVHLLVRDDAGETVETVKLRLLSDARLELMDDSFTVRKPAIHLGESFHLRLTDPDHDQSEGLDTVTVAVTAASGDRLDVELVETLPHSGVFTGHVRPAFFGEDEEQGPGAAPAEGAPAAAAPADATETAEAPADATAKEAAADPAAGVAANATPDGPDPADDELEVRFGDEVLFAFRDDRTLRGEEALDVRVEGRIHQGFNGRQAGFTKRFTDPEMAVKTRFLMAEALFE